MTNVFIIVLCMPLTSLILSCNEKENWNIELIKKTLIKNESFANYQILHQISKIDYNRQLFYSTPYTYNPTVLEGDLNEDGFSELFCFVENKITCSIDVLLVDPRSEKGILLLVNNETEPCSLDNMYKKTEMDWGLTYCNTDDMGVFKSQISLNINSQNNNNIIEIYFKNDNYIVECHTE